MVSRPPTLPPARPVSLRLSLSLSLPPFYQFNFVITLSVFLLKPMMLAIISVLSVHVMLSGMPLKGVKPKDTSSNPRIFNIFQMEALSVNVR